MYDAPGLKVKMLPSLWWTRQTLNLPKRAEVLVMETKLTRSRTVGLIKDPQFGSAVRFGLGSVLVGIL